MSKPLLPSLFCAALVALASTQSAYAAETPSFPSIVGDDITHVVTSPSRWEAQDWKLLGLATVTVVGVSAVADRPVRDYMRSKTPDNTFLKQVENFGLSYAAGTMGAFYLYGVIADNEKSVQVAQDAVAASLISAGIGQTIKVITNRSRPRDDMGVSNFQGYSGLNNNSSFPSGHTTEAFTLASVIATHYDETWVSCTVYSIAGLVGVARMYHDAHFASDVTASAFLGTLVGKTVVNYNRTLRAGKVAMLPEFAPGYVGIRVASNF